MSLSFISKLAIRSALTDCLKFAHPDAWLPAGSFAVSSFLSDSQRRSSAAAQGKFAFELIHDLGGLASAW